MDNQTEKLKTFLSFRLGEELFAANVSKVVEILELPRITKVPMAPSYMRGVINLRGNVLPVIDSRKKFGLPFTDDTINTNIIVINIFMDNQQIMVGAVVDVVDKVLEVDLANIQPPPSLGSKYQSEFIEGMIKVEDQFLMIVDINKVFSSDDMDILQRITEEVTNE
jgi:purine-binding chemotaxis protein CheW